MFYGKQTPLGRISLPPKISRVAVAKGRKMPAWRTPDFTYWLLPAALVGVPVIAGGIVALGQGIVGGILWAKRSSP
jgi:hypothetical protein